MSNIHRIRILTELGELAYRNIEDLNLYFSRIVDDYSDIGAKFGDFSYDFNLPITKQNSLVFGSPESVGSKNYFNKNRNIPCQVFDNNEMILDGLISLVDVSIDNYKCKFFSKFKELIDTINENNPDGEEKTLKSLKFTPIYNWDYETSIIAHIQADYKDCDETIYQYPLSFYSTFYCQESIYSGNTDYNGINFSADRPHQNYYYLINTIDDKINRIYYHQIPPAIYLVPIVEQILEDAGWKLGGQFFNQPDIKKIILLYNGEDDIYDKAISNTEIFSGSTPVDLHLEKFLPDMSQSEFLMGIMNMFNLYFTIDTQNKEIRFETYDTFFRYTDEIDPYDITKKVNTLSVKSSSSLIDNPNIKFKPSGNREVFGDNRVMTGSTDNAFIQNWVSTSNKTFNQTFNRIGYTEQSNKIHNQFYGIVDTIEIPFGEPTIKRQFIYNDVNINNIPRNAGYHSIYLPLLSKQLVSDNNGMKFNRNPADTHVFNNESSIKFQGDPCLMFYYGRPLTNVENKPGMGSLSNYMYYCMYDHSGTTKYNISIPVVSPFQLDTYRSEIIDWLDNVNIDTIDDRRTTVASYLQSLWQMMTSSSVANKTTGFSLVFDDNGYFHQTLWSKFHKYKYERYQQSELLTANIHMTSYDWNQMQINRPIKYRGELYSLVEISGFNPVSQIGQIKLIKKL